MIYLDQLVEARLGVCFILLQGEDLVRRWASLPFGRHGPVILRSRVVIRFVIAAYSGICPVQGVVLAMLVSRARILTPG